MIASVLCRGLNTEPLSSYLGALGLLRLLSTQVDTQIRGAFTPRGFCLEGIDEASLIRFLIDGYRPSPALSPWNAASGFFEGGKSGPAIEAIANLRARKSPRLHTLLTTFDRIAAVLSREGIVAAPKDEEKARLFVHLRNQVPDEALPWIDAVAAAQTGELTMMPILGSGGNEGVLEYSGMFFRSLVDLFDDDRARVERLARAAVLGELTTDLIERAGGQFEPGTAGGFNTGPGFEHKDLPKNPWTHVLLIEGAMSWTSSVGTRGQDATYKYAVSPFTVRLRAAGYGSAAPSDEDNVRAEVWAPTFTQPVTYAELSSFLREGRADVAGPSGRRAAEDSVDFARAVSSLGVDRGVDSFTRYALIKRRGDSYLALPTGRFTVRQDNQDDLAGDLDKPLERIGRFLRAFPGEGPPARLESAARALAAARFDLATGRPGAAFRAFVALGRWEREVARRDPRREPRFEPLYGLSGRWGDACRDEPGRSSEVRLAQALASLSPVANRPFRAMLAPVELRPSRVAVLAETAGPVAWRGPTIHARLASVLATRMRHNMSARGHHVTRGRFTARLDDVSALIAGHTDEVLLEDLLFAFQLVDLTSSDTDGEQGTGDEFRPRLYDLCKLVVPSQSWLRRTIRADSGSATEREPEVDFADEAEVVPLLVAGRLSDAAGLAARRLRVLGASPRTVVEQGTVDPALGVRIAAALLVPISTNDQLRLVGRAVITPSEGDYR